VTTITIDDKTIRTRKGGESPQEATERTIRRIYGERAWLKPRDTGWRDGGESFRGYGDIYRTLPNTGSGWSAALIDSHVWVEVSPD